MKLDKAIEIVSTLDHTKITPVNPDLSDAIKLLLEAGKRCKILAENSPLWVAKPLPGETPITVINPSKDEISRLKESPIGKK